MQLFFRERLMREEALTHILILFIMQLIVEEV